MHSALASGAAPLALPAARVRALRGADLTRLASQPRYSRHGHRRQQQRPPSAGGRKSAARISERRRGLRAVPSAPHRCGPWARPSGVESASEQLQTHSSLTPYSVAAYKLREALIVALSKRCLSDKRACDERRTHSSYYAWVRVRAPSAVVSVSAEERLLRRGRAVLCCAHGRRGSTQAGASRGEAERRRTARTAVNGAVTAARNSSSGAASVRACGTRLLPARSRHVLQSCRQSWCIGCADASGVGPSAKFVWNL
jgi:hypothetical protein